MMGGVREGVAGTFGPISRARLGGGLLGIAAPVGFGV
jgi:hypothetical protein